LQTVPINQLRNELSKFILAVEAGEEIVITRRGTEVARLIPSATRPKIDRVAAILEARKKLKDVPYFDEREFTKFGRKW